MIAERDKQVKLAFLIWFSRLTRSFFVVVGG